MFAFSALTNPRNLAWALVFSALGTASLAAPQALAAGPATSEVRAASVQFAKARTQAEAAMNRLQGAFPSAEATWSLDAAGPRLVTGLKLALVGVDASARALQFVRDHGDLLGAPGSSWRVLNVSRMTGREVAQLVQWHRAASGHEYPVLDRTATLTMNEQGVLLRVASDALPVGAIGPAKVSVEQARMAAWQAVRTDRGVAVPDAASLARMQGRQGLLLTPASTHLVWALDVSPGALHDRRAVYVDAVTGQVLQVRPVHLH